MTRRKSIIRSSEVNENVRLRNETARSKKESNLLNKWKLGNQLAQIRLMQEPANKAWVVGSSSFQQQIERKLRRRAAPLAQAGG